MKTSRTAARRGWRLVCARCGHDLPHLGACCEDCDVSSRSASALHAAGAPLRHAQGGSRLLDVMMTARALHAEGVPMQLAVIAAASIERHAEAS